MSSKEVSDLYVQAEKDKVVQEEYWHGLMLTQIAVALTQIKEILEKR